MTAASPYWLPAWLEVAGVPAWLSLAVIVCFPATLYGLWRIVMRVDAGGPALPLPDGRAFPASRIPMPYGLLLFGAMFLTTVLMLTIYVQVRQYQYFRLHGRPMPPEETWAPGGMFNPVAFAAQVVPSLVGLVVVVWFGRGVAGSIGLRLGSLWRAVQVGVGGLAFVLPLCVAVLIASSVAFRVLGLKIVEHPLLEEVSAQRTLATLALSLVQAAVLAALAEEFMYRGVLMMSLLKYVPAGWAIAASSALWAMVHLQGEPQAVAPLFLLGLVLGYMAYRTRSLVAPVLAHGLFNAVMLLGRYCGG